MRRALALLVVTHTCTALLRPTVRARPMSALDSKSAATIADYDAVAAAFDAGNKNHDVSQNIDALRSPRDRLAPRWAVQQARSGRSSSI